MLTWPIPIAGTLLTTPPLPLQCIVNWVSMLTMTHLLQALQLQAFV
jgi:hypothetical protein